MEKLFFNIDARNLVFENVTLNFYDKDVTNKFAHKNNKTLVQTLSSRKYKHLSQQVFEHYEAHLDTNLGDFLLELKLSGDSFYKCFLNPHGDKAYCQFTIDDCLDNKGLYCFAVDNQIVYMGRCVDSFAKRINYGYGRISPKNCYRDGQSTNCRVNSLINLHSDRVKFHVCSLNDNVVITQLEKMLIQQLQLQREWNIR